MTKVAILPVQGDQGAISYFALANGKRSLGNTAGEALDALAAQLPEEETGAFVIVQNFRPDRYFNADQQNRLAALTASWRSCRDHGKSLPESEQKELEALVNAELEASAARSAALADEMKR